MDARETWVLPAHRPDLITVYHRPVY